MPGTVAGQDLRIVSPSCDELTAGLGQPASTRPRRARRRRVDAETPGGERDSEIGVVEHESDSIVSAVTVAASLTILRLRPWCGNRIRRLRRGARRRL